MRRGFGARFSMISIAALTLASHPYSAVDADLRTAASRALFARFLPWPRILLE